MQVDPFVLRRSNVDVQSNWWEAFFQGVAVDMWLKAIPPEHTRREAASLEQTLGLTPGAELLDVPCGAGRLSLELAARYRITGVDLAAECLAHARAADTEHRVSWERRDMRDLPWPARFDGAFCYGNSFGYLDDEGNAQFLRAVAAALKPGGRFALETPMVIESLLANLQERPWFTAGPIYLLVQNDYDASRSRLNTEYTFVSEGQVEVRRGSQRVYTYRQLIELMESAGFAVAPAENIEKWTRASHTLTLVGTRT
jgi:SAM-dependent methyltransferase